MKQPLTMHELISALRLIARRYVGNEHGQPDVFFDFCRAFPNLNWGSSRCFYERIALDWDVRRYHDGKPEPPHNLPAFLELLESIIGRKMFGWKGGEFFVNPDLPVHVDGPGECTETYIVDVHDSCGCVFLETATER